MKISTKVFILVFVVALLGGFFYLCKDSQISLGGNEYAQNDCSEPLPAEVVDLLEKNNINLARLNHIGESNPPQATLLGYGDRDTGFTYKLQSLRRDVRDARSDQVIFLDACYNGRLILTQPLELIFTYKGDLQTVFAFDFSEINTGSIPTITINKAKKIAYAEQPDLKGIEPKLGYFDLKAGGETHVPEYVLVWQFRDRADVVMDAVSGKIIRSSSGFINEDF